MANLSTSARLEIETSLAQKEKCWGTFWIFLPGGFFALPPLTVGCLKIIRALFCRMIFSCRITSTGAGSLIQKGNRLVFVFVQFQCGLKLQQVVRSYKLRPSDELQLTFPWHQHCHKTNNCWWWWWWPWWPWWQWYIASSCGNLPSLVLTPSNTPKKSPIAGFDLLKTLTSWGPTKNIPFFIHYKRRATQLYLGLQLHATCWNYT